MERRMLLSLIIKGEESVGGGQQVQTGGICGCEMTNQ